MFRKLMQHKALRHIVNQPIVFCYVHFWLLEYNWLTYKNHGRLCFGDTLHVITVILCDTISCLGTYVL